MQPMRDASAPSPYYDFIHEQDGCKASARRTPLALSFFSEDPASSCTF